MALKIYNTLTRKKEIFQPLHKDRVNLYVCGPTVYDEAHLGHARTYINFDFLVRYLKYKGYNVLYVQNITDVGHLTDNADQGEDKILKRAQEQRVHPMELAEFYTRRYFEDMDALKIGRPNISPRASGHILEQIELIKILLKKGYAYEVDGTVYFSVKKFSHYGELSGRAVEQLEKNKRVKDKKKRDPLDFALWKKAEKNHILQWSSPWGRGYPGWHIECSAMAMKYLGEELDIHGGGVDNIFPHHENEIAQSESATGKRFVRFWVHTGSLMVQGKKMSKSAGNFITIRQALKKYSPEALRYFILSSHYREPLNYTEEALQAAEQGVKTLQRIFNHLQSLASFKKETEEKALIQEFKQDKQDFFQALDNGLNTAQALGIFFKFARRLDDYLAGRRSLSKKAFQEIRALFREGGENLLGVLSSKKQIHEDQFEILVQALIELRKELRKVEKWKLADQIRDRLVKLGIEIEDTPQGTKYYPA